MTEFNGEIRFNIKMDSASSSALTSMKKMHKSQSQTVNNGQKSKNDMNHVSHCSLGRPYNSAGLNLADPT